MEPIKGSFYMVQNRDGIPQGIKPGDIIAVRDERQVLVARGDSFEEYFSTFGKTEIDNRFATIESNTDMSFYYTKSDVDVVVDAIKAMFDDYDKTEEVEKAIEDAVAKVNENQTRNYYTKPEADTLHEAMTDYILETTYDKKAVDERIKAAETDLADYYTKDEVETLIRKLIEQSSFRDTEHTAVVPDKYTDTGETAKDATGNNTITIDKTLAELGDKIKVGDELQLVAGDGSTLNVTVTDVQEVDGKVVVTVDKPVDAKYQDATIKKDGGSDTLTIDMTLAALGDDIKVGDKLQIKSADGDTIIVTVTDIKEVGGKVVITVDRLIPSKFDGGTIGKYAGFLPDDKRIAVMAISVTLSGDTILAGSTGQATATVTPDNATNKKVTWSINNTDKAQINETTGTITVNANATAGTIVVTATANDGSGVQGTSSFTIKEKFVETKSFSSAGSDNFVVPEGISQVKLTAIAGGGGGASGNMGGGGSSGMGVLNQIIDVTPGQTIPVVVGQGGAVGQDGGSTSIGSTIVLAGGRGATSSTGATSVGTGSNAGSDGSSRTSTTNVTTQAAYYSNSVASSSSGSYSTLSAAQSAFPNNTTSRPAASTTSKPADYFIQATSSTSAGYYSNTVSSTATASYSSLSAAKSAYPSNTTTKPSSTTSSKPADYYIESSSSTSDSFYSNMVATTYTYVSSLSGYNATTTQPAPNTATQVSYTYYAEQVYTATSTYVGYVPPPDVPPANPWPFSGPAGAGQVSGVGAWTELDRYNHNNKTYYKVTETPTGPGYDLYKITFAPAGYRLHKITSTYSAGSTTTTYKVYAITSTYKSGTTTQTYNAYKITSTYVPAVTTPQSSTSYTKGTGGASIYGSYGKGGNGGVAGNAGIVVINY